MSLMVWGMGYDNDIILVTLRTFLCCLQTPFSLVVDMLYSRFFLLLQFSNGVKLTFLTY